MTDQTYTVAELGALRAVVERKCKFGTYLPSKGTLRPFYASELEIAVSNRCVLHMLAGHTAEDLIQSEVLADRASALASARRLQMGLRGGGPLFESQHDLEPLPELIGEVGAPLDDLDIPSLATPDAATVPPLDPPAVAIPDETNQRDPEDCVVGWYAHLEPSPDPESGEHSTSGGE